MILFASRFAAMTVTHNKSFSTPTEIAAEGERIYAERYKQDYEIKHPGKFVAVDVTTGEAYLAEFPEEAIQSAQAKAPKGLFHLIKIGAPGAFRVSYSATNARSNWLF